MYISMSRLDVEHQRCDELIEAFRSRIHLVDHADGFVDLQVWQSDRDPQELIMVSRWRSRDDFTRYMQSDDHKLSHERIDASLQAAISLQRLDHLHTYNVVAE